MIKNITIEEAQRNYIKLEKTDPNYLDYAVAFTRVYNEKTGYDEVEYYGELKTKDLSNLKRKTS